MEALSADNNVGIEGPKLTLGFYVTHYTHTDEVHDDLSWQVRNRVYHYKRRGLVAEPSKLVFCLSALGLEKLKQLRLQKVTYLSKLKNDTVTKKRTTVRKSNR